MLNFGPRGSLKEKRDNREVQRGRGSEHSDAATSLLSCTHPQPLKLLSYVKLENRTHCLVLILLVLFRCHCVFLSQFMIFWRIGFVNSSASFSRSELSESTLEIFLRYFLTRPPFTRSRETRRSSPRPI